MISPSTISTERSARTFSLWDILSLSVYGLYGDNLTLIGVKVQVVCLTRIIRYQSRGLVTVVTISVL